MCCRMIYLVYMKLNEVSNLSRGLHTVFEFMKANTMYEHEYYAKVKDKGEAALNIA